VQPSTLRDYDDRDMFCLFLLPGNNLDRKVVALPWLFLENAPGLMFH
jgi:hypothetical protein